MPQATKTPIPQEINLQQAIVVQYKNWRNEVAERTIIPIQMVWGSTEWHKKEQWLLNVWDVERHDYRMYALKDILKFL